MNKLQHETFKEYLARQKRQEQKEKWYFIIGVSLMVLFFSLLFVRAVAWDVFYQGL